MKTIREIVDTYKKTYPSTDCGGLEKNLYGKMWEAMVAIVSAGKVNDVGIELCVPATAAIAAEEMVVAWWNKKEGIES